MMTSFAIQQIIDRKEGASKCARVEFDPDKHLAFQPPVTVLKWAELGFPTDHGIAPICATQPYQLFAAEAVHQMRAEIFQRDGLNGHAMYSNIAAFQVRGFAAKHAPFIFNAWKHPRTPQILSTIAGLDLSILMDYEVAHFNFSPISDGQDTEGKATTDAVVGWHKDSYPYTCTLMLSDWTDMIGGEVVLQRADESCSNSKDRRWDRLSYCRDVISSIKRC
jgi:hypothetical protein